MINRFTTSVAAIALIAGTSLAYAQGTGTGHETPSAGSTSQQSGASSEHGGASMKHNEATPGSNTAQAGEKAQSGQNQRAQSDMKAGPKQEKSAQENSSKGERSKTMSSENDNAKGNKEMKAESREDRNGKKAERRQDHNKMKAEGRENRNNMKAEGREGRGNMKAEGREDRNNMKAEGRNGTESKTVGQAGAGAKLSTEQRTKITSVFREQHVAPITHANFAISVGTRVPRGVSFHRLPAEIVTIYPEWRGYEFVRVRDQIVVVDPNTLEIVAVLEA